MALLDQLPVDILLLILEHCDIITLNRLYRTNLALNKIIAAHVSSIGVCIARSLFCPLPSNTTPSLVLLNQTLIPVQMAAIMIDRFRFSHHICQQLDSLGIPASHPFGATLRVRIASGLRVLHRLSCISQRVYSLPATQLPRERRSLKQRVKRVFSSAAPNPLEEVERRERLILDQRREVAQAASLYDRADLHLCLELLYAAFRSQKYIGTYVSGFASPQRYDVDFFDWEGQGEMRLYGERTWVHWFILHEGPALFWEQWTSFDGSGGGKALVRKRLMRAWDERDDQRILLEREFAAETLRVWRRFAPVLGDGQIIRDDVIAYMQEYLPHRHAQYRGEAPQPKEILDHIPYFIDMQGGPVPSSRTVVQDEV